MEKISAVTFREALSLWGHKEKLWLCIHKVLPCNPIDQQSEWLDRGTVSGIGRIEKIMEKSGKYYAVFLVRHGAGRSGYFGSPKCIPISALEEQGTIATEFDSSLSWYIWGKTF